MNHNVEAWQSSSSRGGIWQKEYRCSSLRIKSCPDKLIQSILMHFILLTYWGSEFSLACLNPLSLTQNTCAVSTTIYLISTVYLWWGIWKISCHLLTGYIQPALAVYSSLWSIGHLLQPLTWSWSSLMACLRNWDKETVYGFWSLGNIKVCND